MPPSTDDLAQSVIQRNRTRDIPIPDRPWASYQSWDNLLTCHWPHRPGGAQAEGPGRARDRHVRRPGLDCPDSDVHGHDPASRSRRHSDRVALSGDQLPDVRALRRPGRRLFLSCGRRGAARGHRRAAVFPHAVRTGESSISSRPATAASASKAIASCRRTRRSRRSTADRDAGGRVRPDRCSNSKRSAIQASRKP